ncbi:hypothetical protein LJB89_04575 [Tyzzerella sp. OttesenSCG-928-J15]|nr:hypothetical protein [Tyzzerella sp. OttesenSCG-928-J15]
MLKKKIILTSLVIAALSLFSACGGEEKVSDTAVNTENAKVEEVAEKAEPTQIAEAAKTERKEKWEKDIDNLAGQLNAYINKFSDADPLLKSAEFEENLQSEIQRLKSDLAEVDDFEIEKRIQMITALFNDGHMVTDFMYSDYYENIIPLQFNAFGEGIYCTIVYDNAYKSALNCRLEAVNGKPVSDIFEEFSKLFGGDNIYNSAQWFGRRINCPAVLKAIGIIEDFEDSFVYTLTDLGGNAFDITVDTRIPYDKRPDEIYERAEGGNAYYESREESIWTEYIEADQIFYIRMRMIPDSKTLNIVEETLEKAREANDIKKIIVDLRDCEGGQVTSIQHSLFAESLKSFGQDTGQLYVITNYATFSMGATTAMYLKNEANATVVGLPAGGGKPYVGNPKAVKLSATGFSVELPTINNYANGAVDNSIAAENYILMPDIEAGITIEDYVNKQDSVLEIIKNLP